MTVNGLPLPAGLIKVLHDTGGEWGQWEFKQSTNAYGDPFDADFEMSSLDRIIEETTELPGWLEPYAYDETEPLDTIPIPGFIPDVKDYSKIVWFGKTGSGEPFCLDYRESLQQPKVIFRQDGYWRRAAPDFDTFWALLETEQ